MKIDETAYHEYANWRLENEEILKELEKEVEDVYFRFKHVIDVVDYFYNRLIDDKDYSEDDDVIFKTGFYYIADQIEEYKILLKDIFNQDKKEVNNFSKEVNLYFNALDFQTEIMNREIGSSEDVNNLLTFDKKVYQYLQDKKTAPIELYDELDILSSKVFQNLKSNYYSVNNIFLEIADELNIL